MSKVPTTIAPNFAEVVARIGPYPQAAYAFLQEGLRATVRQVHEERAADTGLAGAAVGEHVSGQQLCLGLRDHAIEQFGLLAPAVLAHWNIHRTEDFGRMVFGLIDAGLMSKTPQDSPEDFRSVYDFAEAFDREHVVGSMRVPAG